MTGEGSPASMAREVDDLIARSADAVEAILARGIRAAMNDYNGEAKKADGKTAD